LWERRSERVGKRGKRDRYRLWKRFSRLLRVGATRRATHCCKYRHYKTCNEAQGGGQRKDVQRAREKKKEKQKRATGRRKSPFLALALSPFFLSKRPFLPHMRAINWPHCADVREQPQAAGAREREREGERAC